MYTMTSTSFKLTLKPFLGKFYIMENLGKLNLLIFHYFSEHRHREGLIKRKISQFRNNGDALFIFYYFWQPSEEKLLSSVWVIQCLFLIFFSYLVRFSWKINLKKSLISDKTPCIIVINFLIYLVLNRRRYQIFRISFCWIWTIYYDFLALTVFYRKLKNILRRVAILNRGFHPFKR